MIMSVLQKPGTMAVRLAAAIVLFLVPGAGLFAAGLQVTPIIQEIGRDESMATYRVSNTGNAEMSVEVRARAWRQETGERVLEETDALLVVPGIANIAAGESQLVRVALRGERPDRELAFRVVFEELPRPPEPGFFGVQTNVKVDVPLFFSPAHPQSDVDWRLSRASANTLVLEAVNEGNRHARFSDLVLNSADGLRIGALQGPIYILPGKRQRWRFQYDQAETAANGLILKTRSDARENSHVLAIE